MKNEKLKTGRFPRSHAPRGNDSKSNLKEIQKRLKR